MENLNISHIITGLALALTFGGMTFFSAVMAPLVFTKLPFETAGAFIRQVFPWYYLTMGITTLIAMIALVLGASGAASWESALTALVLLGFIFARQLLMPMINHARDAETAGEANAAHRFGRLHRISVVINAVQWIAVLAALILVLV
jgi:hypothetical protein